MKTTDPVQVHHFTDEDIEVQKDCMKLLRMRVSLAELALEVASILINLTAHYNREKTGCSPKMEDPRGHG